MNQKFEFPESFIKNDIDGLSDEQLCADALIAWDHCHMKVELPETFSETMAKIAKRLNVLGTPESFMEWSKQLLENTKEND